MKKGSASVGCDPELIPQTVSWHLWNIVVICHTLKQDVALNTNTLQKCLMLFHK